MILEVFRIICKPALRAIQKNGKTLGHEPGDKKDIYRKIEWKMEANRGSITDMKSNSSGHDRPTV